MSDEPSPTRSEESFDDRYREVTAKHEEVQRRLRARQKTLRAAELAAKQAKIREMESELARLEQVDGLTLADEAKFEAEVAEYDVEHKLRAHQERLAQLEETLEAKRLEALALWKMKSVELELAREIHTLDDDIERIGSAAATRWRRSELPCVLARVAAADGPCSDQGRAAQTIQDLRAQPLGRSHVVAAVLGRSVAGAAARMR